MANQKIIKLTNKKAILLSPFFYPEPISTGKYNTYLAEELVERGFDVTVITSHPLYPNWQPVKTEASLPGMLINRGGAWLHYPKSTLLRRAVLELWFAWRVLSRMVVLQKRPSKIVSVFPPSLFFFLLAPFISCNCKTVGIIHDLQSVYASRSKSLVNRLVNAIIHFVENRCFKACNRLIFLSSSMKKRAILEYGLDDKKCVVCYPFVAFNDNSLSSSNSLTHLFDKSKINVVYSGALGDKQNPDGLLDFFYKLADSQSDIICHIFSAGPHFERLRSSQYEKILKNRIFFHELVEVKQLNELYACSDIQIIPQAFETSEGSLPSKLPNLIAAGVPVFIICETQSELATLVNDAKAGIAVHTWDPNELVIKFIESLPMLQAESRNKRKVRLQKFIEDKFSIHRVVDEIMNT